MAERATKQSEQPSPGPKLIGKKRPLNFSLPPELVEEIDALAKKEDRSRAKTIERLLRRALAAGAS